MTTRDDLLHAIQKATEGTPYTATPTEDGFDVHLLIADAQWYGLFNKAGLNREYACREGVRLPGQDRRGPLRHHPEPAERRMGGRRPLRRGQRPVDQGSYLALSTRKIWALDENFHFTKVVDYSFRPNEGLQLIRTVGKGLGLRERTPVDMKIGIAVALFALVGAVAALVVLGILAWSGNYHEVCTEKTTEHTESKSCHWERNT